MIPYEKLLDLPGMPEEKDWLQKHLETLTVREYMTLSVAQLKQPAKTMMDAVEQICSLSDFTVCPAESYEELGTFYLDKETCLISHIPQTDRCIITMEMLCLKTIGV